MTELSKVAQLVPANRNMQNLALTRCFERLIRRQKVVLLKVIKTPMEFKRSKTVLKDLEAFARNGLRYV